MAKQKTYPRSQPVNCAYCGKFNFRLVGYKEINYLHYCSTFCREARAAMFTARRAEVLSKKHATGVIAASKKKSKEPRRNINTIPGPSKFEQEMLS